MSILFLTLGSVLFLLPLWTQNAYRQLWHLEARQIRLDNLAIELGRKDRTLFRDLSREIRALAALEQLHHVAHACARVPSPQAASCAAQDKILEVQVNAWAAQIEAQARLRWASHSVNLRATVNRTPFPPLKRERCSFCGLQSRFRALPTGRRTGLSGAKEERATIWLVGERVEAETEWNYRMEPE